MAAIGQVQQVQQEIQNELLITTRLLRLIHIELEKIKVLTKAGGELEANIEQNASLLETLSKMQQLRIEDLPPSIREIAEKEQQNSTRNMDEN